MRFYWVGTQGRICHKIRILVKNNSIKSIYIHIDFLVRDLKVYEYTLSFKTIQI